MALRVAGLSPGMYHYRANDHCLEKMPAQAASRIAREYCADQPYVADAAALFIMTAVFERDRSRTAVRQKVVRGAGIQQTTLTPDGVLPIVLANNRGHDEERSGIGNVRLIRAILSGDARGCLSGHFFQAVIIGPIVIHAGLKPATLSAIR